jgi:hypothetical protein
VSDEPKLTDRQQSVLVSMRAAIKAPPIPLRACGECVKCCDGWLAGSVYGHAFTRGTPCFFLEKTCSIYKDRPVDPCKNYRCGWLAEDIFPMWMKPHLVNVIITKRQNTERNIWYYIVDQAGDSFDQRALNWLISWATSTNTDIEFRLDGEVRRIGSSEFVANK